MVKAKVCSKGYSCGLTCINRERNCSKELTGQSVQLTSLLANLISDKPAKGRATSDTHDLLGGLEEGDEGFYERIAELTNTDVVKAEKMANAVSKFTQGGYVNMRKLESEGRSPLAVRLINEYLAKAPTWSGGPIYRGLDAPADSIDFKLSAMSSFSSDLSTALDYAQGDSPAVLKVVNNKSGCSIRDLSYNGYENEVLVPKETKYRTLKTEIINGIKHYEVEEI